MRIKLKSAIVILLLLAAALGSFAQAPQYIISGIVYDSVGFAPMPNANVFIEDSRQAVTTHRDGTFKIRTSAAESVLCVSYMGYRLSKCTVNKFTKMPLKIYLSPEVKTVGEVTVKFSRFRNIIEGDSLRVLDYEIWKNRLLILAESVTDSLKQRIYLANLNGYIYSYRNLKEIGKSLKFPDDPSPRMTYLFRDTYGEIQLLAKTRVWQIYINKDKIFLLYPSKYDDCTKYLFPIKCRLNNKLFFQEADERQNATCFIVKGTDTIKRVKLIHDEFSKTRYLRQRAVKVPLLVYNNELVLFNFFDNKMELFNEQGRLVKKVPILFHTKWYYDKHGKKAYDLDASNFTQDIIIDQVTNKVYSIWRTGLTGRYWLKQIDMVTGEVIREVAIPDHRFIDKILVNDNLVYFLYRDRQEQRYRTLYTMSIL